MFEILKIILKLVSSDIASVISKKAIAGEVTTSFTEFFKFVKTINNVFKNPTQNEFFKLEKDISQNYISLVKQVMSKNLPQNVVRKILNQYPTTKELLTGEKRSVFVGLANQVGEELLEGSETKLRYSGIDFDRMRRDIANKITLNSAQVSKRLEGSDQNTKEFLEKVINTISLEGEEVILSSSWIRYGVWKPIKEGSDKGTMILNFNGKDYNFGTPNHGKSYPLIDKKIWVMLKYSASAGKTFWNTYYGSNSIMTGRIKKWKGASRI